MPSLFVSVDSVHNKGHKFLIQSMRDVVRSHPHAILLLVGDGPAKGELTRLVFDLQLEEHVRILGERSMFANSSRSAMFLFSLRLQKEYRSLFWKRWLRAARACGDRRAGK